VTAPLNQFYVLWRRRNRHIIIIIIIKVKAMKFHLVKPWSTAAVIHISICWHWEDWFGLVYWCLTALWHKQAILCH